MRIKNAKIVPKCVHLTLVVRLDSLKKFVLLIFEFPVVFDYCEVSILSIEEENGGN